MKKLFFVLVLAIGLVSFTSSNEVESVLKNNLTSNVVEWNSCTVGSVGGTQYTVMCDCSTRRACRKARRLMRQQ
ncbi:MAG: hypothetical protein ACI8RP_000200 [Urechidicola sp.]|jgi:hypothetical protein|tara:strand:- start:639 stop:860 length:222 start_codon:yes stop_codon:yes gene_type:complete